jgi:hypothetical protein
MTDARFPERWLNDRRIQQLPHETFFAFANALMWSVSNRTDGVIKFADLELVPRCKGAHADELVRVGLWRRREYGWLITVYKTTQRSRKQLESDDKYRERERERVARLRAAEREQAQVSELDDPDVRTYIRAYVRTDNIGQDRAFEKEPKNLSVNGEQNDHEYFAFAEPPTTDCDGFPPDDAGPSW